MNKRYIAIVLTALMLLTLSACGCQRSVENETLPNIEPVATEATQDDPYNPLGGAEVLDDVVVSEAPTEANNKAEETEEQAGIKETESTQNDVTEPTVPAVTEDETEPPQGEVTEPEATEPEATEPEATEPEATEPDVTEPTTPPAVETEPVVTAYEQYHNMSGSAQKEFIDSFPSIEAFVAWYENAKAEYDALHPSIDVGGGSVDLGG